ncbi:MAG: NlpC/P60 family protein [Rhodobacteraceae bacterium]|nr:NlpC/P60 family protein [Paracoccaceae bacterium]
MTVGADDVVRAARAWLGTPYRHGASVRGAGADCLGLVRGVWRDVLGAEPEVPGPYTADWGEPGRVEILWEAAARHLLAVAPGAERAPGEVLLFRLREGGIAKHMGILSVAGPSPAFIHSYSGHGVVESALTEPWRRRLVARFRFPQET